MIWPSITLFYLQSKCFNFLGAEVFTALIWVKPWRHFWNCADLLAEFFFFFSSYYIQSSGTNVVICCFGRKWTLINNVLVHSSWPHAESSLRSSPSSLSPPSCLSLTVKIKFRFEKWDVSHNLKISQLHHHSWHFPKVRPHQMFRL